MSSTDIVYFLMPDGTKVSNDPRFDLEEAREEMLAAQPNKGDVGITEAEQKAQTQVEHVASLNSGQKGVGENSTPDDPVRDAYGPLGSPAMQIQKDDLNEAKEAGASPSSTSVDDAKPVDSNKAVQEARDAVEKAREATAKAAAKLGEDGAGDPDTPKSEWSAAQLRYELMVRNATKVEAGEEPLSTEGISKKSQLAELLDQDDASNTNA